MRRNMYKICLQEKGSVLMESLLVLPVYLILLSGIFWIGEVGTARLALIQGEHVKVWETSYRGGDWNLPDFVRGTSQVQVDQERDALFWAFPQNTDGSGAFSDVTSYVAGVANSLARTPHANSWGRQTYGYVTANIGRSVWSWAIPGFFTQEYYDGMDQVSDPDALLGKNPARLLARRKNNAVTDTPQETLFLSRHGDGGRNDAAAHSISTNWNTIYLGRWDFPSSSSDDSTIIAPTGSAPEDLTAYGTRDSYYNAWSL